MSNCICGSHPITVENTKPTATELNNYKVSHIRNFFPEVTDKKFNPFRNPQKIAEIKKSLYDAGLYGGKYDKNSANIDSAIINMVLRSQGKDKIKRPYVGKSRIEKKGNL